MAKNYYVILGIASDATADEIRAAYRNRAKELHPDRSGEGSEPFQDVQEAYAILSDPHRRQVYDTREFYTSPSERPSVEPISPVQEVQNNREQPVDLEEVSLAGSFHTFRPSIDELFDRLRHNFGGPGRSKSELLEPLHVEILLSPEEARRGGQIPVGVPARVTCPTCLGRGRLGPWWCMRCKGAGRLFQEHLVMVTFPPGIRSDYAVHFSLDHLGIDNFYLVVHFRVV